MENLQYLFLAFSSVFIILFLYVSHLRRLTIDLDNEVKELKELLINVAPFYTNKWEKL